MAPCSLYSQTPVTGLINALVLWCSHLGGGAMDAHILKELVLAKALMKILHAVWPRRALDRLEPQTSVKELHVSRW